MAIGYKTVKASNRRKKIYVIKELHDTEFNFI